MSSRIGASTVPPIRREQRRAHAAAYVVANPKRLSVFVHGLSGSIGDSYWGALPKFLRHDVRLGQTDLLFWGYRSNKLPCLPLVDMLLGEALPAPAAVAANLKSDLHSTCSDRGYEGICLLGHSLGGVILSELLQLGTNFGGTRVCRYACLGSPFNQNILSSHLARNRLLARAYHLYSQLNPQLRFLADRHRLEQLLATTIATCRSAKIATAYFAASGDEIVDPEGFFGSFDEHQTVSGGHNWMQKIADVRAASYSALVHWMAGTQP